MRRQVNQPPFNFLLWAPSMPARFQDREPRSGLKLRTNMLRKHGIPVSAVVMHTDRPMMGEPANQGWSSWEAVRHED